MKSTDYLKAYAEATNARVVIDPHQAAGGKWKEMGLLQFNFLKNEGLLQRHSLLDIGCGTLRGGLHFIQYLSEDNYTGIDVAGKAIEYANVLIEKEELACKRPQLSVNKDLKFEEFKGKKFNYILAQSVFYHLKTEYIEECFRHIGSVMYKDTLFFFTFKKAVRTERRGFQRFCHPFSFFVSLAEANGFFIEDCSSRYRHPRDQSMVRLVRQ